MQRSAGDVSGRSLFWTGVAVFLLAVVVARIIFQGGDARVALLLAVPLLFVVLGLRFGWVLGILMTLFFVAAVFAVRAALHATLLGIAPLLMLPFLGLAAYLAWNVIRKMRAPRTAALDDRSLGPEGGDGRRDGPDPQQPKDLRATNGAGSVAGSVDARGEDK